MSYCRWSSDDFQCDVYVYEDCRGGFTTHVAGSRPVFAEPLPPKIDSRTDFSAWFARGAVVRKMLKTAGREFIDLPHDGETFNDATAALCADRLETLRRMGYNVPQRAIDALREEAAA